MILNRRLRIYNMAKKDVTVLLNEETSEIYSPIELGSYEKKKHIPLDQAYSIIKDQGLSPARLQTSIENKQIHVYEFDNKNYISRLDLGRIYHENKKEKTGLTFERYFTKEGESPFNSVRFQEVNLEIKDYKTNKIIFEMKGVEIPEWMDEISASIVASRYFFKPDKKEWKDKIKSKIGKEYEFSLKNLNQRVADFFADEGEKLGYFATEQDKQAFRDELLYIQINGLGAFNSPVQFNAGLFNSYGIEGSKGTNFYIDSVTKELKKGKTGEYIHPQLHACFIKGPADDLESILEHGVDEGLIFACGSGIGQEIGALREDGGSLSGGGKASGPNSFTIYYDAGAGTIKSGGKTRRAARMTNMFQNHPDIMEFIRMKPREDHKALTLIQAGYSEGMDGEAYQTVSLQNTNLSVRLDDSFFEKLKTGGSIDLIGVKDGKVKGSVSAEQMLKEISFGSWRIGDPSVQYDSQIQKMHTCPNSGTINASNPCGEYLNVDDTSCNLFSLRMTAFFREDKTFDVEKYSRVIRTAVIAQNIANKAASYPVKSIAIVSPEFSAIGMGYSDFGAALMRLGIPYDSDKARELQGLTSALMTGKVYETSAELAQKFGTFTHFELNKKQMLNVMSTHKKSLEELISHNSISDEKLKQAAIKSWENVISLGEQYGFANSQATAIAPTGTISFLMGSSTTGIEPCYALITRKSLAGGGTLTLINKDVRICLEKLGYDEKEIEDIQEYITFPINGNPRNTVIGAPHLKPEHYTIFDTAQGGVNGKGVISPFGHISMVAASQPFISGGISKTINAPEFTKVKEIYDQYILGHELGLKGLTFFRDNSKPSAVLGISKLAKKLERGEKKELPFSAEGFRQEVKIQGSSYLINVGEYADGKPGEIVINSFGADSTLGALLRQAGISASKALKRGVELEDVLKGWIGYGFDPRGFVQVEDPETNKTISHLYIKLAQSPLDFVGKLMLLHYKGMTEFATEPDKVNIKDLRGFKNGAFRTYKREKLDDWNFEDVINDFEWGGFVQPSEEDIVEENGNHPYHSSSSGVLCKTCGREMKRDGVNCLRCETCGDKVGGCGG